jgi:teichuronic acid exporter
MTPSSASRIEERVARSVVYVVGSRVVIQVFATLSTLLVARWLHPEDYGVLALAGTVTIVVGMLGELGVGAAVIQFRDLESSELNAAFWASVLFSTLLYAAIYVTAPFLSVYFSNPDLSLVLRVSGIAALLSVVRVVPEALLRKRLHLDKISLGEVLAAGVNIPLVLGLAWAGAGVWALVAGMMSAAIVQCILSFVYAGWSPGLHVGSKRFRRLLGYSWASLGSKLSWSVYNQSDRIVLGRVVGSSTLGFYAMATDLALVPVEKVASVVNQILAPVLAESQGDHEAMSRSLLRGVRLVAWAVFPLCFGLMAFADPAIPLVLTAKWSPIIPLLQVLCLYAAIRSLTLLFPPVLMATYRADLLFVYNIVLLVVLPAGFVVGAWLYGVLGVAWAWAILYPLVTLWMVKRVLDILEMRWISLARELGPPAASTVLMLGAALLADRAIPGPGIAGLSVAIAVGAVVHVLMFVFLGGDVLADVRRLGASFRASSTASVRPAGRIST